MRDFIRQMEPEPTEVKGGRWLRARMGVIMVPTALVWCPDCRILFSLSRHIIQKDGTVSPSVVCPNPFCRFHDFVKLVGWNDSLEENPSGN